MAEVRARKGSKWWYLVFLIQAVAVLWVPFYNTAHPDFIGLPFFYWYQLLWVLAGVVINWIIYAVTE